MLKKIICYFVVIVVLITAFGVIQPNNEYTESGYNLDFEDSGIPDFVKR